MTTGTTTGKAATRQGSALFSLGFRPFFLGAALWATLAMGLWLGMLTGSLRMPTAFDPVSWHAHEFLFGYLGAVIAGFMMTAVPNWTGRAPIAGRQLGGLFIVWVIGRLAIATSAWVPASGAAAADLAFPVLLLLVMTREIIASGNLRNLKVLVILSVFIAGNAVFHWEASRGLLAAEGAGLRLGLAAAMMLIAVIGGRIIPSFTRNWLQGRASGRLPVQPEQRFDFAVIAAFAITLGLLVGLPEYPLTGWALVSCGILHAIRLARWAGERTAAEPLLLVLHVAYAFVALGSLSIGIEVLLPGNIGWTAALHPWMAGAIGLMTMAVMTRATLGHTGRALTAGAGTTAIYAGLLVAVFARMAAGVHPASAGLLYQLSGFSWMAAFAGFVTLYGGLLIRSRPQT